MSKPRPPSLKIDDVAEDEGIAVDNDEEYDEAEAGNSLQGSMFGNVDAAGDLSGEKAEFRKNEWRYFLHYLDQKVGVDKNTRPGQAKPKGSTNSKVDKSRKKLNPSSTAMHAESGKVAAVATVFKARAVGPLERIKFKEVLKRRGGLQEYLDYRNHTLSAWNNGKFYKWVVLETAFLECVSQLKF